MTRDDIPTPALLLDLDRFERNLRRMAAHARAAGKNLRPHAKTHRCPEIARRQVSAGALGVACAKLGEAEVMARAGIRGLLITTEVVAPAAIRRLMRLVSAAPDTLRRVDNPDNVARPRPRGRRRRRDVNVLVDVDVGKRRTGVAPGEPALAIGAGRGGAQRALRLRGLQGYAGHCAHVIGWEARQEASHAAMTPLMETRALLERGRPARRDRRRRLDRHLGHRRRAARADRAAGGLLLRDGHRLPAHRRPRRRALTEFEMALTVITTVVSVPTAERAMVDGGLKAFSTDKPFPPESVERPGVEYGFAGDEHGRLTVTDPSRAPRLGERIEFFPPALRSDDQPLRPDLRDARGHGRGGVGDRRARPERLRTRGTDSPRGHADRADVAMSDG